MRPVQSRAFYFYIPDPKRNRVRRFSRACGSDRKKYRDAVMEENILTSTPSPNVSANPLTRLVPNQYKIAAVIKLETFESRIEDHARRNPSYIAPSRDLPARNSSFIRSKISILASPAIPMDKITTAMPADESVTGINLNKRRVS